MTRVGSWIWDLAQKRVTCSGEMLRMFGFDRSEPAVALDRFWNRIHEQDRDRVTAEMDQALSVSNRFESPVPYRPGFRGNPACPRHGKGGPG